MAKGGSKVVTGIISFLLGFLFAIIVEIGAIVGVAVYVMRTDLETLLDNLGIGDNKYINTDPNSGGAETLGDLFARLKDLFIDSDGGLAILGKSFDDISSLIPATDMLLDMVYGALDGYLTLDREEFESTPLNGLAQVLSNSLMYTETYGLMEKLNMDSLTGENANVAIKSLLLGAESKYASVSVNENLTLPVLHDVYVEDESIGYSRKYPYNGVSAYPDNLRRNYDFLEEIKDEGDQEQKSYRLYYVPCRITEDGVFEADYSYEQFVIQDGTGSNAKTFKYNVLKYGEDTDFVVVSPDATGKFLLDYDRIWAAKNNTVEDNDYSHRFKGYSYDVNYARNYFYTFTNTDTERKEIKAICGYNYFKDNAGVRINLDPLTLADVIGDTYAPLYSIPVSSLMNGDDDVVDKLFGKTSLGALMDGKVDMQKVVNDVEMSAFVDNVSPNNKIMANIVFKLSDIDVDNFTAIYDKGGPNEQECTFELDNGYIAEVKSLSGTVLEGSKIREIAGIANNLKITAVVDIKAEDAILMYVGYGVTDVNEQAGQLPYEDDEGQTQYNTYNYQGVYYHEAAGGVYEQLPCFIKTNADGAVIKVWYYDSASTGEEDYLVCEATSVNALSARINVLTDHVGLNGVIDVDPSESIITYVGFGITDVEEALSGAKDPLDNAYSYSGKYKIKTATGETAEEVDCYITLDDSGKKIVSAWYIDSQNKKQFIYGTRIKNVPERIEGMKDDMKLGNIIDIKPDDPQMLQALKDTTINGLNDRVKTLTVGEIFKPEEIEKSPMLVQLKNTKVVNLASAIDDLMIQQIYSSEVYRLPKDDDPMEVVKYDASYKYYEVTESTSEGKRTYSFVLVGGSGTLSADVFNSTKASKTYYTYGLDYIPNEQELAELKMKIVGYDASGNFVDRADEWIYYVHNDDGQAYTVLTGAGDRPERPSYDETEKYYSYGFARGMWKLILYKDGREEPYTINNFNNMVISAASNVYKASLKELQEAGVIDSGIDLNKTFQGENLANMTFERLIQIVVGMAS